MSVPAATPTPLQRRQALADFRAQLIRDAAKHVFAARGIQDASLREIAKSAGCTTGAIYSLYDGKESLYADVLRESMQVLGERLAAAAEPAAKARSRTGALLQAMLAFYEERPEDFDLSFYLFGGARPVGLRDDLNQELNDQAAGIVARVGRALREDGLAGARAGGPLAVSAVAQVFGIALLAKTGRLRSWGQSSTRLLADYIALLERGRAAAPAAARRTRRAA